MNEGTGASRAPFECVCGFTAGTSFAWEKHLALRNTPYSSVKHSRVIRASGAGGEPSSPHKALHENDSPLGMSRHMNERDADIENTGPTMPYPTPKALFRDRPGGYSSAPDSLSKPSPYARSPSPVSNNRSVINGIRLEEAAKRGDMDRVARLAVEILRLAQQGDPEGVLDVIADRSMSSPSTTSQQLSCKPRQEEVKFAANITAVHQSPSGISIEQVCLCLRVVSLPFSLPPFRPSPFVRSSDETEAERLNSILFNAFRFLRG